MPATRPQIRRTSAVDTVTTTMGDWENGLRVRVPVVVELVAEEWLNQRTQRYGRRYSARRQGALGWHLCATPQQAIRRALALPNGKRLPPGCMALANRVRRAPWR